MRDVTDQHVAEMRLAESEARFRDLADQSTDIVWHVAASPELHFDYVSPSVERILGYPPSFFTDDFRRRARHPRRRGPAPRSAAHSGD